ncbi:MAG TPA: hypothetical protein VFD58_06980 [Blastocatellia bacterium]|nr:hypothetical protein [Blastocatellia bacterium]
MMTENTLATLISGVCHDAGKMKGIEFHPPATWGAQVTGSWEAGYRLRRQGHSTVTLSYWFSVNSLLSADVILPWAFPPTPEQSKKFKSDVSSKIDGMLQWL